MKTEVKEENNEYTLSIDREQHTGFDAESTAVALALHLHTCMHIAYVWRRVLVGVESAESVSVCTDARKMADDQIKALKRSNRQLLAMSLNRIDWCGLKNAISMRKYGYMEIEIYSNVVSPVG